MLEGGRPYSAVSKDCACKKTENNFIMSTDNVAVNELKILQQEKLELEQQLKGINLFFLTYKMINIYIFICIIYVYILYSV